MYSSAIARYYYYWRCVMSSDPYGHLCNMSLYPAEARNALRLSPEIPVKGAGFAGESYIL